MPLLLCGHSIWSTDKTVIAGASPFNGVILLADTRTTIRRPGRLDLDLHCDTAQKLFPLTRSTVIGFSGDNGDQHGMMREWITGRTCLVVRPALVDPAHP